MRMTSAPISARREEANSPAKLPWLASSTSVPSSASGFFQMSSGLVSRCSHFAYSGFGARPTILESSKLDSGFAVPAGRRALRGDLGIPLENHTLFPKPFDFLIGQGQYFFQDVPVVESQGAAAPFQPAGGFAHHR